MFKELIAQLPWSRKPELNELYEDYISAYVRCAELMDDVVEILTECKQAEMKIGIVSNGESQIQRQKIMNLGISHFFDLILISGDIGISKPDELIFLHALRSLNVTPEEAVFIGDHPVNDVYGAKQAGLQSIWINSNKQWDEQMVIYADFKIISLSELRTILSI